MLNDPMLLAQKLIQFPSVAPNDAGIVDFLINHLEQHQFKCKKLICEDVTNLYARSGDQSPNFCFAGHVDVVPVGGDWSVDPFTAIIQDGMLYGRGASDMKAAMAAFISASVEFKQNHLFKGSISFLISGNEEGVADNGTPKLLEYLERNGQKLDACVVGEPTCAKQFGDIIKYGRRGSITFHLTVQGTQGHVAYPSLADNPINKLVDILSKLKALKLDDGTPGFDKSNLEIIDIKVGNEADNVIPGKAEARFNIRFNDMHSPQSLKKLIHGICGEHLCVSYCGAEAFIGAKESPIIDDLRAAVFEVTQVNPELSTTGGTSDARFIKDHCPVIEFGLLNKTAHHVDEHVAVEDVIKLKAIYYSFLKRYFKV